MSFIRQKRVYVNDVDEFNKILKIAKNERILRFAPYEGGPIECMAFLNDGLITTELTIKAGSAITYVFNKDCRRNTQEISGMDAYIQLSKAFNTATGYSLPVIDKEQYLGSAVALLGFRPGIAENERVYAYAYDQNSSYGWALTQPMPDTRTLVNHDAIVGTNQIGFILEDADPIDGFITAGGDGLKMVREGHPAEYIFNLMESPFKKFAETWYKRKCKPETKNKAKQMICYSVGYLQRKNPFLRATVVGYSNELIKNLIDENTIYVNTDSIISTKPRPDLSIGTGLGQFKIEHEGMFARDGYNYQWNFEIPTYRGTPKTWFKEGWDILKDPLPKNHNLYELNSITLQMEAYK